MKIKVKSIINDLNNHMVRVTSTEAKLFTIRCSTIQVTHLSHINQIVIIVDSIHAAKKIFNFLVYLYQL